MPKKNKAGIIRVMNIAVYGLGRFGFFWSGVLSRHFGSVSAFSRNSGRAVPDGVLRIKEEQLSDADVVFLCCSISSVEEVCRRIAPLLKPGAVVIDTCSVKVAPVASMQRSLPDHCGIIATHPMFGPDSGRGGINGLPFVFCRVRDRGGCTEFWLEHFRTMGLDVIEMTPDEHDSEAAFTQGITHFVGRVLEKLELRDSRIATLGYVKLQEIVEQTCNDPLQLFMDLQQYNPHTREMRIRLKKALDETMDLF